MLLHMEFLCIAASAVAAVFGAGSLLRQNKTRLSAIIAALLGCVSAFLFGSALRYAHGEVQVRGLGFLVIGGVLVFYLSLHVTRLETERRRVRWYPVVLALPAVLADIVNMTGCLPSSAWAVLESAAGISLLLLCAASIAHVFRYHYPASMTVFAWIVLGSSAALFAALAVSLAGLALGNERLFTVADAALSVLTLTGALLSFRKPDAAEKLRAETVARRYERSTLAGLDVEGLIAGLEAMVARTALYRRPDCSLNDLARRMGLTRHQVSELLNERMGINFSTFINRFRVEEARGLLESRPELTVLAVALEVGFGNKTSFNEAFRKSTGRTPRDFRKRASR